MKTLDEIKDEVAKEHGFVHWLEMLEDHVNIEPYWPEVCRRYAEEVNKPHYQLAYLQTKEERIIELNDEIFQLKKQIEELKSKFSITRKE